MGIIRAMRLLVRRVLMSEKFRWGSWGGAEGEGLLM